MDSRADVPPLTVEILLEAYPRDDPDLPLLEVIAARILDKHPSDTQATCQMYMRGKLQDMSTVREAIHRLRAFDGVDETLSDLATDALRTGDFDGVHRSLAIVEDSIGDGGSTGSDLPVAIRVARAETALLQDAPVDAARHFVAAATYLERSAVLPSRGDEGTVASSRMVGRLIQYADFYGGDGGWIDDAMQLCHANVRHGDTHPWNRGARQMDAGLAQLTAGKLAETPEALNLFLHAEYAFRIASWRFGKDTFPADWAAAENCRGLAFAYCCFRDPTGGAKTERTAGWWIDAEDCYRSAMAMQSQEGLAVEWAKTCANLGFLLLHRGRAEGGERGHDFLTEAIAWCKNGQKVLTRAEHPGEWVGTQQIVVDALIALGGLGSEEAKTHYREALAELTIAQDFLESVDLPVNAEEVEGLVALVRRKMGELLA